jgi:PAS domain S-box-containing protein
VSSRTGSEQRGLPNLDEQQAKIKEHDGLTAVIQGDKKPTVLLADGDADMRESVQRLLQKHYRVIAIANGQEALDAVLREIPDLVLADITMPVLDGLGLLTALRSNPATQVIPIVLMSARAGEESRIQGFQSGADDYLTKPFTHRELLARVGARLALSKLRKEPVERERDQRRKAEMAEEELRILQRLGMTLSAELDLKKLVQAVTDAGRELSKAEFGAFFNNLIDSDGEKYQVHTLSGAPLEAFEKFGLPSNTSLFGPTFRGECAIRIDDVYEDPRYGKNAPFYGMPPGHLPVRSYLAIPVISRSAEVLGGLFFGHREVGVFTERAERLIEGLARQAAVAIDNARLYERAQRETEERKRAEGASVLLAAIVQSSDDAIISKDLNGMITSWNRGAEQIFGYTAEEAVGQPVTLLMPPERVNEEPEILRRIRSGERIEHYETVRSHQDGTRLDISLSISPLFDNQGQVVGASKIARNITDRKRMEATLLKAHGLGVAGRMAASIAHEINNPLEAVTNLLYLMRSDVKSEIGIKYLATAEAELARVAQITRKTLAYYRDTSKPESLDLSTLITETLSVFVKKIGNKEITVVRTDQLCLVHGFKGDLLQLFSNLIANAIDAVSQGGRIDISVSTSGEAAVVAVHDNGAGIAPDHKSKLFEPFFTTKEQHMGTGLGLWISREIARKHGAEIAVESSTDASSHGTTLTVTFSNREPAGA